MFILVFVLIVLLILPLILFKRPEKQDFSFLNQQLCLEASPPDKINPAMDMIKESMSALEEKLEKSCKFIEDASLRRREQGR